MKSYHVRVTDSANIERLAYFPERQVLQVAFKGGKRYRYTEVPQETWDSLVGAESRGAFFAKHVRDKYPTERM